MGQHKASSLQQNGRVLINEGIKHGSLHANGKLLSQNGKVSLQNFNARDGSHSSASDSLNGGSSQGYQEGKLQQYYLEEHFSDSTIKNHPTPKLHSHDNMLRIELMDNAYNSRRSTSINSASCSPASKNNNS